MEKGAKLLEAKFPDEALALYTKAADTVGNEDRPKEASEYLSKVAKLQVRNYLQVLLNKVAPWESTRFFFGESRPKPREGVINDHDLLLIMPLVKFT